MNPTVKTVLPLITWTLRRAFGPVFEPSVWRAVALSFVPPTDSLINVIERESAGLDTRALLSPTERRRIRKNYQRYVTDQLANNPMCIAMREYMLRKRERFEAEGHTADSKRIRKLWDIEGEVKEYYAELAESHELAKVMPYLSSQGQQEAVGLLWEFATYGEGGIKPEIRRSSVVWKVFGLDPVKLQGMPPKDGLITFFSRFEALLGLDDGQPEESNLQRLLRWIIRTHLPPEEEPETTPHAIGMAIDAGLIYKGHEVRDKETGEVTEIEVEDPTATSFIDEVETSDQLRRIISRVQFSRGERVVLDGMLEGLEGSGLEDWIEEQGAGVSRSSVPVLANRVRSKLRKAARN